MQQLAISNDWLPVDQWIAEALDNSVPTSQIEADLVDCLLFWSAKHSRKGASSRDSLAKSLEAVRILVSLGIEIHLAESRGVSSAPSRIRDFFKAPFTRLKTLESKSRIESILGMEGGSKPLPAYWNSESKERIDNRLYAMVRKKYDDEIERSTQRKELLSTLMRLIRITAIPCQMVETRTDDTEEIHLLIRTILAMHLNRIKRPTTRRKFTESSADPAFKGFEPLSKDELKKIRGNASLTGTRKKELDRDCAELIQILAVSDNAMRAACNGYTGSWTDYVSRLLNAAQGNANTEIEKQKEPLLSFEHNFICEEEPLADKSEEDEEILCTLMSVFTEHGVEYSRKDLESARGVMPKDELDSILRKAEKRGFISSRKEGSRKLFSLAQSETL